MNNNRLVKIGWVGRGEQELAWQRNRPLDQRVPHPRRGQVVLYRSNDWGPLQEATVVRPVADDELPGGNPCSQWADSCPLVALEVEQPIPASKIDPKTGKLHEGAAKPRPIRVLTWESRLEGSAGWLPLDHEQYNPHRPPVGR